MARRFPFQREVVPAGVQDDIGYAMFAAQLGEISTEAKPLDGLGGVMGIAANDESGI